MRRRKPSPRSIAGYACLFIHASLTAGAADVSPGRLIDRAPVIRSSDESCRSIELAGCLRADASAGLTFRVIYRAPDHFAVLIRDAADGTPLLLAADRKMLLYDPVRSVLLWSAYNDLRFTLAKEGDALRIHLGVTTEPDRASNILVDVKSLVAGPSMNDQVVPIGDNKYRLTRTTEMGNTLQCALDLNREQPYTKIDIIKDKASDPCVSLNVLMVNGALGREEFSMPARAEMAERVDVQELPGDALAKGGAELTLLMRACVARAAINKPEMREAIKAAGFTDIDWNRAKEADKKISRVLRDALSTTPRQEGTKPSGVESSRRRQMKV
jgi:hypothetical protein